MERFSSSFPVSMSSYTPIVHKEAWSVKQAKLWPLARNIPSTSSLFDFLLKTCFDGGGSETCRGSLIFLINSWNYLITAVKKFCGKITLSTGAKTSITKTVQQKLQQYYYKYYIVV